MTLSGLNVSGNHIEAVGCVRSVVVTRGIASLDGRHSAREPARCLLTPGAATWPGSGLRFEDRGEHQLKGIPDEWHLFALVSG